MTADSTASPRRCPECQTEMPPDSNEGLCPRCLLLAAADFGSDSFVGQTISHYRILEQIARGGMGVVYKAEDTRLGRFVAIKFVRDEILEDAAALGRFKREALAVATLHHPNICPFIDFGEHQGRPFLVTEYLEGETLDRRIARSPLPLEDVLDFATQVAEALKTAHGKGFIHRDIKPSNIFVTRAGEVKLLDFGLTKPVGWDPSLAATVPALTATGTFAGTIPYMSPEQLQNKSVDSRTDFFSFGIVLYEMATGKRPFRGDSAAETIAAIQREDPAPLESNGRLGRPFGQLVSKLLAKDPEKRYSHARELLADLENIRSTPTIGDASRRYMPVAVVMLLVAVVLLSLILAAPRIAALWGPAEETAIESIAVLPFQNLSESDNLDLMTVAMTYELIKKLTEARISDLRVLPRTATMAYRSQEVPVETVIEELGVDAVIEGSVEESDGTLLVHFDLTDGRQVLLTNNYERDQRDLLGTVQEIGQLVADQIRTSLSPDVQARLAEPDTVSYLSRRDVYTGQFFLDQRTREGFDTAVELFTEAMNRSPDYADAWAGRAHAYVVWGTTGYATRPAIGLMELARMDVARALDLDPDLAEAYAVRAMLRMSRDWDWEGARADFERALMLDADVAETHHWYALFLSAQDMLEEALEEVQRAESLDSRSALIKAARARIHYYREEFVLAERYYEEALDREPESVPAQLGQLIFYVQQDRLEEALDSVKTSLLAPVDEIQSVLGNEMGLFLTGRDEEAVTLLAELGEQEERPLIALYVAIFYAFLGNVDETLDWLDTAADEKADYLNYIQVDPLFDHIRGEPAYAQLLEKIGL